VRTLDEALKQATGRTAHALVHEHLLRMAQALLVQTSLSIKEIAYQLEFNEPAHFTNFFKKYTQQTPLQFRQREQQ
jgi:AraC family transcriptional activator of pobA